MTTKPYDRRQQRRKTYESEQATIEVKVAGLQRDVNAIQNTLTHEYECAGSSLEFSDSEIYFE